MGFLHPSVPGRKAFARKGRTVGLGQIGSDDCEDGQCRPYIFHRIHQI
jgi:hypothetical protein